MATEEEGGVQDPSNIPPDYKRQLSDQLLASLFLEFEAAVNPLALQEVVAAAMAVIVTAASATRTVDPLIILNYFYKFGIHSCILTTFISFSSFLLTGLPVRPVHWPIFLKMGRFSEFVNNTLQNPILFWLVPSEEKRNNPPYLHQGFLLSIVQNGFSLQHNVLCKFVEVEVILKVL